MVATEEKRKLIAADSRKEIVKKDKFNELFTEFREFIGFDNSDEAPATKDENI